MQLSLLPLDPPPCLRYFIRADGRHAGGITVHSVQGAQFSYGVAVSGDMRRRGVALACCARLILTCLDRGLYPSWDAANQTSLHLAESLGYAFSHEYAAYWLKKQA